MNTSQALPVALTERSDILDVLRGFALFGVLFDNIIGFSGWGMMADTTRESLSTWPADGILGLLEFSFIKGKFYSLFSLLFGIGFSIILIRNQQKGINPLKVFYRRLLILLLIGAAHMLLLWEGDILFLYALIGLFLPLFRKCFDKTLLITAAALIVSPVLIDLLKELLHFRAGAFLENAAVRIDNSNGIVDDNYRNYLYKDGSGWQEWRNWQEAGFLWRYSYLIESNRIPKVLGMFLLGFYAGRKMMYAHLENYVSLFKKLRLLGFVIGIPSAIAATYFELFAGEIMNSGLAHLGNTFFYAISVVPLCLAYTSVICLHWIKKKGNSKLKVLAPMGRMALTNYLMQTILCISIFYGVGFGFGGKIGLVIIFPIAIGIYLVQIIYSSLWFKYFNYGPIEWMWRMWTYGKRLKILKNKNI
jgi:uncharacterized protein